MMFQRSLQLFHPVKLVSCYFPIYQSRPQGVFPCMPVLWAFAFLPFHPSGESLGTKLITTGQTHKYTPTALCCSYSWKQLQTPFCYLVWGSVGLPCLLSRATQGLEQIYVSEILFLVAVILLVNVTFHCCNHHFFFCGKGRRTLL